MNILICDDSHGDADELRGLLEKSRSNIAVHVFYNGQDVLTFVKNGGTADCCILDIIMPDMTGIELAKKLRNSNYTGEIVFLSVSREYGPETYEVKACSYLIKPVSLRSVEEMLTELENTKNNAGEHGIMVKTAGVTRFIPFSAVSHAEVSGHKIFFRLIEGGDIEVYGVFSELAQKLLADPRFVQCHRSFIVNMQYIESISKKEIISRDSARIPVSRSYPETGTIFHKWKTGNG